MKETSEPSPVVRRMLEPPVSPWRNRLRAVLVSLSTALLLGFCGVCGFSAWFFRPELSEDPELASARTAEMLRVQVPEKFAPRGTVQWNLLWLVDLRGSYYELLDNEDGLLMFLQVDSRLMSEPDIRDHVERTLREKGSGGPPLKIVAEQPALEFVVRGVPVRFRSRLGELPSNHSRYRLVEGVVDGNAGKVLVAFRLLEDSAERKLDNDLLIERTITNIL
ncbi:MAG: hypothetical protein R3B90_20005 [Planctomycetaceae bacterium]